MAMTYRIVTHKDDVDTAAWFTMAAQAARVTRTTADPLNVIVRHERLDIRRNFFSVRVTEDGNKVPSDIKQMRYVEGFKNAYAKHCSCGLRGNCPASSCDGAHAESVWTTMQDVL